MTSCFQRYFILSCLNQCTLHHYETLCNISLYSVNFQGGWENDETVTEAACREALEEAGVKGIVRVS